MLDEERLERIKEKIGIEPGTGTEGMTADDAGFLLKVIAAKAARVAELEKKSAVLSHHIMELTEELENVKMDFGGGSPR